MVATPAEKAAASVQSGDLDVPHFTEAKKLTADERKLAELGYKQELTRGLSMLTNFGSSFCILSYPTGVAGSFGTAWFWGGPVTAIWGWLLVSLMICGFVGPAMAEIGSSLPTSGGMYFWAAKLGGRHGRFMSWLAGWFNLLGQVSLTSSVTMAATSSIIVLAVMATCPSRLNRHGGLSLYSFSRANVVEGTAIGNPTVPWSTDIYKYAHLPGDFSHFSEKGLPGGNPDYAGGLAYLSNTVIGTSKPEPCPVDSMGYVITSSMAYIDPANGLTTYKPGTMGYQAFLDAGNSTSAFGAINSLTGAPYMAFLVAACKAGTATCNFTTAVVTDLFSVPHTTLAYSDSECLRQPFNPTQPQVYAIFVGVMFTYLVINCMSISSMDTLLKASILFHVVGGLVCIIGVPIAARKHLDATTIWSRFQPGNWGAMYNNGVSKGPPGSTVFTGHTANNNINYGGNGISATDHAHAYPGAFDVTLVTDSTAATQHQNYLGEANSFQGQPLSTAFPYIFFCGMLMSQWSFTGYDASIHMCEETHNAAVAGPQGLFRALVVNAAFGFAFIVSIISSIPDFMNSYFGPLALNYNPVAQIYWDVMEERTGNGRNACGFWMLIMVCMYLCGISCLTSNARMLYAFARDDALPGSRFLHVINAKLNIPLNAMICMGVASAAIALPDTYSTCAYAAVTSITTIGLYISYGIPFVCRLTVGKDDFIPGPFYLGDKLSVFVHTVACGWICLICVIFVLPNTYPINMQLNFNYAIIAVGIVLAYTLGTWFIPGPRPFNARVWFKGPHVESLDFDAVPDGGPGASVRGGNALEVPLAVKTGVI